MDVKIGRPFVKVPVVVLADLGKTPWGNERIGQYASGLPWPLAILKPGTIKIKATAPNKTATLAHEMQHAKDMTSPLWPFRRAFTSRRKANYWLEMRAEIQSVRFRTMRGIDAFQASVDRLQMINPGRKRDQIVKDWAKMEHFVPYIHVPTQLVTRVSKGA